MRLDIRAFGPIVHSVNVTLVHLRFLRNGGERGLKGTIRNGMNALRQIRPNPADATDKFVFRWRIVGLVRTLLPSLLIDGPSAAIGQSIGQTHFPLAAVSRAVND